MAAQLGWQQKWSASGLTWDSSWSDGFSIGAGTMASVGHMTIAGAFTYGIVKSIGAATLALGGHASIPQNGIAFQLPEQHALGNVALPMRGMTTLAAAFNTVDPKWIDPPLSLAPVAHIGFQAVTLATITAKPLGALSLPMVGHASMTGSTGLRIRHAVGAGTLPMAGGMGLVNDGITPRTGAPIDIGAVTLALTGRGAMAAALDAILPPHDIGAATLALGGRMTLTTPALFSGGPKDMGSASMTMRGAWALAASFSYPPFDRGGEINARIDETAPTMFARIDGDAEG